MRRASSFPFCIGLTVLTLWSGGGSSPTATAAPATLPSVDEVRVDFDGGKYPEAIKKAVQLLQLPGEAGKAVDKPALLSIKAESHLRLKQVPLAIDAWIAAAKESGDPKAAATFRATAALMKKSSAGKYQPKPADAKSPRPEAIDVLETESRKKALGAYFKDESGAVLTKMESLKKQKSLSPVMEGVKQVSELRTLELAATEGDATTKQIYTDLTTHAIALIKDAATKMSARVEEISRAANESQSTVETLPDGSRRTITRKRGLFSDDTAEIKGVASTCEGIVDACEGLARTLGAAEGQFEDVKLSAGKIAVRADEVLKADYGRSETYGPAPLPRSRRPQDPERR